jgi:hypothetical protein
VARHTHRPPRRDVAGAMAGSTLGASQRCPRPKAPVSGCPNRRPRLIMLVKTIAYSAPRLSASILGTRGVNKRTASKALAAPNGARALLVGLNGPGMFETTNDSAS